MKRIFDYPEIPMSIACGLVFAIAVAIGIIVVKRYLHGRVHGDAPANEVVNTTLSVFSLFYGILLGLLVVGAYDNYSNLSGVVSNESSAVANLYRNASYFPEPTGSQLKRSLGDYAQQVVDHSFAEQARGIRPRGEFPMIDEFAKTLNAFEPRTASQQNLQAETLRGFSTLLELRHDRLSSTDTGLPPTLWWIVILGAVITLILICLLDYPLRGQLIFGCMLAFFIGTVIFVIASQEHPFSGFNRVGPEELQYLINLVR
ncbi:MAG: DUF4239 domain-containing protein [Mycobacteriaceae bacterium]